MKPALDAKQQTEHLPDIYQTRPDLPHLPDGQQLVVASLMFYYVLNIYIK